MTSDPTTTPAATEKPEAALLAEFDGPEALKAAAAEVRRRGFTRWDVHSPFPIHGIQRAMGIRPTRLPWLVLGAGIAGAAAAVLMQWWTNALDYPIIVSGKPLFSLPANVPIIFEVIVLLSALAAFGGALALCRLPQFSHPLFASRRFRRVTTDGFFISIDPADPKYDEPATRQLLDWLGATAVELSQVPSAGGSFPRATAWIAATAVTLALLPPLLIAWYRCGPKPSPRIHIIQDMDFQPKYRNQAQSPLFADRRAMRPLVEGAIAEGHLESDDHLYRGKVDGQWATGFPVPLTKSTMQRGQQRFNIYCAPCHGLAGQGDGIISLRALELEELDWRVPTPLAKADVRQQPAGQIFGTISNGLNKMAAYGPQIPAEDRWAIVLYVRALQRSQSATAEDVPEDIRNQFQ